MEGERQRLKAVRLPPHLHVCMRARTHAQPLQTNKQINKLSHSGCTRSLVQFLRIDVFIYFIFKLSFKSILHRVHILHNTPPFFSLLPFLMSPEIVLLLYSCPIYIHILYIYKNREPRVRTYKSFRDCLICCT